MIDLSLIVHFIPHAMLLLISWKMTLGPGVLFFHKLKSFSVLKTPIFNAEDLHDTSKTSDDSSQKLFTLNAFQLVKIPLVQDFFFLLGLPGLYFFLYLIYHIYGYDFIEPDTSLFYLTMVLLAIPCIKLLNIERKYFSFYPILYILMSLSFPGFLYLTNFYDFGKMSKQDYIEFGVLSFFETFLFSPAGIISGRNYYNYIHPSLDLVNYSGFRSILLSLYSRFTMTVIYVWQYMNLITLISFFVIAWLKDFNSAVLFILVSTGVFCLLNFIVTKKMLQFQLITILLPFFRVSKNKETPKLKKLIRSLGPLTFGMSVLPIAQTLLLMYIINCYISHKDATFFIAILLNGICIQSSQTFIAIQLQIGNPFGFDLF